MDMVVGSPNLARPRLARVEVIINPLAGGVGPDAIDAIGAILAEFGVRSAARVATGQELAIAIRAAVDAAPDLVIALAGDGTARATASLCGPDGPLVAPLAGGTLNMLPHALYGPVDWKSALRASLADGEAVSVSGGEIDHRRFYVAAMLGAPARWARAREAARVGKLGQAMRHVQSAWKRTFVRQLSFSLDGKARRKTQALTLMTPLVSRVSSAGEQALEAVVLDFRDAAEAFRLGVRTVAGILGADWRADPAVEVRHCRRGQAWSSGRLPAILDGEPMQLHKRVDIRFIPKAFRALAPRPPSDADAP
jgi:diacylglycerol kinase family enzyme